MRYLFFGAMNVVVTWSSYALLVLAGVEPALSNAASWVIGVAFAFVVNKLYVFNSKSLAAMRVARESAGFAASRVVTGAIAIVSFPILYDLGMNQGLFGVDGFPARIAVSGVEIVLNYLLSKYMVFRKRGGEAGDDLDPSSLRRSRGRRRRGGSRSGPRSTRGRARWRSWRSFPSRRGRRGGRVRLPRTRRGRRRA